jgi:hypothetical protein
MSTKDFVVKNGLDVTEVAIIRDTTDSTTKDTGALIVEGGAGIEKNLFVGVNLGVGGTAEITGNTTITGDLAVNGGDLTTTSGTATLFNANATTLNVGQAATTVSLGATSGTTTVRNALTVGGAFTASSGAAAISPANANVVLSPTGTGVVTINPATLGTINNMSIGASTRSTGAFTTLTANGITTITSTQAASSVDTGALQVDGGVGINGAVFAGSIQDTPIGSSTRSSGAFTTLTSNAATTFTQNTGSTSTTTGTLVVTGGVGISERLYAGSLQNTPIGSSVASSAAFTSLTANAAVTFTQNTASTTTTTGTLVVSGGIGVTGAVNTGLSSTFAGFSSTSTTNINPANASVSLAPTGTGSVTINPATAGTINNMSIGATTASTGSFTNLTVTGSLTAGGVTGTSGQALVSTGTGIQWATPSALTNGTSNVSVALNGNITITRSGTLVTTFSNTNVNIPLTTASNSTTTGALTVNGGVGIVGNTNIGGNLVATGLAAFGPTSIDPDDYGFYSGGFGNIADGSGWGARGLFVHGGGAGDAAAIGHNGSGLYFGIQNGTAANTMTGWLEVTPARAIAFVNGTGFTYNSNTIWHAGNDGAGSGLDADTLDGFGTSQAAAGTTIPVRDSSGYLYGNYINMSDNSQSSGVTAIVCKAGDNFYRSATAAATATFISGQTMNINGSSTSCTGNSATATTAGTVTTAAQPNITSVGTLTSLTSSGNISGTGHFGTSVQINGNGSSNDPYGTIAVTEPANANNYSYYGLTRAGQIGAGFGLTGSNGALGLGANAYWFGGATSGTAGVLSGTAWLAFNSSSMVIAGTFTEQSSIKFKENVKPIDSALNKVLQLQGVTYDKKDKSSFNEPGLIAEDVLKVIPELVQLNEEGDANGIHYTKITAYLIECIKELNAKIERLESKNG